MAGRGKDWLDRLGGKWRAEKSDFLKWKFGESSIVRYAEQTGCKDLEAALVYIKAQASFVDPEIEDTVIEGTFTTLDCYWGLVPDFKGRDTFRLYHVMISAALTSDTGKSTVFTMEDGCRYKVTYTYYRRQAAITTPTSGASGVGYKVIAPVVDPKTGLYTYILEERERITQTVAEYEISDDQFKQVTAQDFDGVRTGDIDDEDKAVALWDQDSFVAGTLIETHRYKNEDCTNKVVQTKTVAHTGISGAGIEAETSESRQGLINTETAKVVATDTPAVHATGPLLDADGVAVDPPVTVRVQTAGTYHIYDNVKRMDDLYDVTTKIESGYPLKLSYDVADTNGTKTICRWWNHTSVEQNTLIEALTDANKNTVALGGMNRFGLYDGGYISTLENGSISGYTAFSETVTSYGEPRIIMVDGVRKVLKYKYTATYRRGLDQSTGLDYYSGALGSSFFQTISGNVYYYKRVTKIEAIETDYVASASGVEIG